MSSMNGPLSADAGGAHAEVLIDDVLDDVALGVRELEERNERFRLIFDTLPVLISYLDREQRFRFANQVYQSWFEIAPESLIGQSLREFYGQHAYDIMQTNILAALAGREIRYTREVTCRDRNRWVEVLAVPHVGADGSVLGLCVLMTDITERLQAESARSFSERRLRTIADNLPALISYIDRDRRYQFCNATYFEWWGIPVQHLVGRDVREALGPALYDPRAPFLERALSGERIEFDLESVANGQTRHTRTTYIPDLDEAGHTLGVYTLSMDVTPLKRVEVELLKMAQFDALTGLPNRHNFDARLRSALARREDSGAPLALLFLDLDGLKGINDSLGHAAGDEVLCAFATRLSTCVRPTDTVARLAGDEFVVILEALHSCEEAQRIAEAILASTRSGAAASAEGSEIKFTTSIGVAYLEKGSPLPSELMHRADRALYEAKTAGRDTVRLAL